MIRFDNVHKRYANGREALTGISFGIADGEMTFLTGHSGAGKSSILKLIALLERATRGQVFIGELFHPVVLKLRALDQVLAALDFEILAIIEQMREHVAFLDLIPFVHLDIFHHILEHGGAYRDLLERQHDPERFLAMEKAGRREEGESKKAGQSHPGAGHYPIMRNWHQR